MDLAAIIIVGTPRQELEPSRSNPPAGSRPESLADLPLALLDVVGKSVVHHVAERLQRAGVEAITALTADKGEVAAGQESEAESACQPAGDVWRAAEEAFLAYASEGVEDILLLRLGPYAEFDVSSLLQFHRSRRHNATLLSGPDRPLDAAVVQGGRRNDASFLIRNGLRALRAPAEPYITPAYVNRLESARDLRRLAQDALLMRCDIRPDGRELKPGVWVGQHARIHRTARVLAPAFVGTRAKLRAASVVTRCSVVEHHAEVDCGTVLEDTSVLPYTYVGTGLDASHAVAGFGRVVHLPRQVEVEINDPRLLGTVTASPSWRMLKSAAALAAYLPVQATRGLIAGGRRMASTGSAGGEGDPAPAPRHHPAALEPTSEPVSASNQGQFGGDFAVVRRYGNE